MANPKNGSNAFDQFFDLLADRLAQVLAGHTNKGGVAMPASKGKSARGARAGKKLDMSCRVAGCKNRSRGPRFGFMCDEHGKKLSKAQQRAARDAWKAKHAAA